MLIGWPQCAGPLDERCLPNGIRQEAFEHDDRHLRHLARLRPGDRLEVKDIWEYTQDLLYTGI
jgi:hypothetical protein